VTVVKTPFGVMWTDYTAQGCRFAYYVISKAYSMDLRAEGTATWSLVRVLDNRSEHGLCEG
jgi:hypothetical protein